VTAWDDQQQLAHRGRWLLEIAEVPRQLNSRVRTAIVAGT
jgi:hypothetical protein